MRTIKELADSTDKRIYIYLKNDDLIRQFLNNAEHEGYKIGNGKPTKAKPDMFYAVNKDMTLNYIGGIGRIAFQCNDKNIVRVDYAKYISNVDDFLLH